MRRPPARGSIALCHRGQVTNLQISRTADPRLERIARVRAGMIPTLRANFPPLLVQILLTLQSNYHFLLRLSLI